MTEEQMKKRLYDLYQLDWLMSHGYSLHDVIKGMDDHEAVDHDSYIHDSEVGMYADIERIFSEWEGYVGFPGGCIYVCFDEFCHAELLDADYIPWLLEEVKDNRERNELREAYKKWLENNEEENEDEMS